MTKSGPPSRLAPSEYEAIEQAMMETARGRWFLAQFAEKNRRKDTQVVLEAISKLESTVSTARPQPEGERIKKDLVDMSQAIARTRHEIANLKLPEQDGGNLVEATEELDAIVRATEQATTKILQATEDIQETAWTIREDGSHEAPCARIDNDVTDIYTACSFQDITGQRTQKVVQVLRYLEARINAMVSIWGLDSDLEERASGDSTPVLPDNRPDSHLLNGPQQDQHALKQNDIDGFMDEENSQSNFDEQKNNESDIDITANFIAQTAQEVEVLSMHAVEVAEELILAAEEIAISEDDDEDVSAQDMQPVEVATISSSSELDNVTADDVTDVQVTVEEPADVKVDAEIEIENEDISLGEAGEESLTGEDDELPLELSGLEVSGENEEIPDIPDLSILDMDLIESAEPQGQELSLEQEDLDTEVAPEVTVPSEDQMEAPTTSSLEQDEDMPIADSDEAITIQDLSPLEEEIALEELEALAADSLSPELEVEDEALIDEPEAQSEGSIEEAEGSLEEAERSLEEAEGSLKNDAVLSEEAPPSTLATDEPDAILASLNEELEAIRQTAEDSQEKLVTEENEESDNATQVSAETDPTTSLTANVSASTTDIEDDESLDEREQILKEQAQFIEHFSRIHQELKEASEGKTPQATQSEVETETVKIKAPGKVGGYKPSDWVGQNLLMFDEENESIDSASNVETVSENLRTLPPAAKTAMFE